MQKICSIVIYRTDVSWQRLYGSPSHHLNSEALYFTYSTKSFYKTLARSPSSFLPSAVSGACLPAFCYSVSPPHSLTPHQHLNFPYSFLTAPSQSLSSCTSDPSLTPSSVAMPSPQYHQPSVSVQRRPSNAPQDTPSNRREHPNQPKHVSHIKNMNPIHHE
ncbi:hypothetical protein P171DRAFT_44569 [Karstenula rhodostoma CBS 690.94]|uniref:Uncharacterized protein n=1 Tax=Karstenula rhodostoma CBS 690.94 TaxID=1392251 RepID=A0A9P4PGR4_9PLEO|nr:hypothetical protein P171DRAFT_44569 [Karstenula rhodostoma CBS 690.94]